MKKIYPLISNLLFFSLLVLAVELKSQSKLPLTSKLSADTAVIFKRTNYASDNPKVSELDLLIDTTIRAFMQSPQNCGLSIGITHGSKQYFYNYGEIKRDAKVLADSNTIYEIGAISTIYTAYLLAQAVKEKKLNLEDDIRTYLPEKYTRLSFHGNFIRIKHLASHSSGLPTIPANLKKQEAFDKSNPYVNYSKDMLFNYLKTIELKEIPGTQFLYSSLGYALLGIILEECYQIPYDQLVREKITDIYGLGNTCVRLTDVQRTYFATGYNSEGLETPHWEMGVFNAAGGIRSNTKDLLKWLDFNRLAKNEEFILTQSLNYKGKEKVGLAWFVKKTKFNNQLYWHDGATFGFAGLCGFIKEKEISVVILSNSERNVDFLGLAILNYLQQ